MNILEVLAQLRDDIKTWVTNNLNYVNDSQTAALTALKNSLDEKISTAIDKEGFSGDYDDLTNAPIKNDTNGNFIIVDEQNNKILEINEDGLYTTNVFSDGVNLKSTIENNKAEQNAKNADLEEKIQDINTNINNLPFQDLDGENFAIVDNDGRKIAEFNQTGFHTTDIFFKPDPEASEETNLQDALDNMAADTAAKINVANDKIDSLEAYDESLKEIIKDSGDGVFILADEEDNKILQVDSNGLRTTKIIFKPEANGEEIDLHAALKQADEVRAEVYGENGSVDGSRIDSLEAADDALGSRIETLETAIGENGSVDEKINAAKAEVNNRIDKISSVINIEENDEDNKEFIITDNKNNIIAKIDNTGLSTIDLFLGDVGDEADPEQPIRSIKDIMAEKVAPIVATIGTVDSGKTVVGMIKDTESSAKAYADSLRRAAEEQYLRADREINNKLNILIGSDTNKSVRDITQLELANQLLSGKADADFKTLQELAAWLEDHPEDVAALNLDLKTITKEIFGDTVTDASTFEGQSRIDILEENFDGLPFEDYLSEQEKSFAIVDDNGNKIAEFDDKGLFTTDVRFKTDEGIISVFDEMLYINIDGASTGEPTTINADTLEGKNLESIVKMVAEEVSSGEITITIDEVFSDTSPNPVQNSVITNKFADIENRLNNVTIEIDDKLETESPNPVKNSVIYAAIEEIKSKLPTPISETEYNNLGDALDENTLYYIYRE